MKLSDYLKQTGQNMLGFSKESGISYATIWRITNETTTPRPHIAVTIQKATGGLVTAGELVFHSLSDSG